MFFFPRKARVSYASHPRSEALPPGYRERGERALMARSTVEKFTIVPRLLTRQEAAVYCGVSVPTFEGICPVKAIALGNGKRLERFDRVSLDGWISSLAPGGPGMSKDWFAELEKQ